MSGPFRFGPFSVAEFTDDGWYSEELDGWEGFKIRVRVNVVAGQPCITALQVESPPETPHRITHELMRTLPYHHLAVTAWSAMNHKFHPDFRNAREHIEVMGAKKHDPRAQATVEVVAAIWNEAYRTGQKPRHAVCKELELSPRTADRYIARARDQGLIAIKARSSRGRQPLSADEAPENTPIAHETEEGTA